MTSNETEILRTQRTRGEQDNLNQAVFGCVTSIAFKACVMYVAYYNPVAFNNDCIVVSEPTALFNGVYAAVATETWLLLKVVSCAFQMMAPTAANIGRMQID